MTIYEESFLSIRDDHPEIDSEIRSILIARAQTGATISNIREDYRKITGTRFPVYKNVTDFLLCIPGITVYCDENGTRIFNVVPNEKNKHIYDFVVNQKPTDNGYDKPAFDKEKNNNRSNYTSDRNNTNKTNINEKLVSRLQQLNLQNKKISEPNNYQEAPQDFEMHDAQYEKDLGQYHLEDHTGRQLVLCEEESDGAATATTENNCYYEDNYNYIYSRMSTQKPFDEPLPQRPTAICDANNNLNSYKASRVNTERSDRRNSVQPIYLRRNYNNNRPLRLTPKQNPRTFASSSPTCTRTNTSFESFTTTSDYVAHLLDFILLGDDFFLYLARMELKCKFKKGEKVLQSGLCVSGQTIKEATRLIRRTFDYTRERIIINIGSVDIMRGKSLVQIEYDYRQLLNTLLRKGFQPILTTIAPIANRAHDPEIKATVNRFNDFIRREGRNLQVIDIDSLFVNEKGQIFYDCYQNAPRFVTGTDEPYVFWNKIGRQRVLKKIKSELSY